MAESSGDGRRFGRTPDRPRGAQHWAAEQEVIGPGLQAVMLWAQLCVESAAGAVLVEVDGN